MTKSEIVERVREHLSGAQFGDITFSVGETGVQAGDGWYRVTLRPSHLPESLFALYEFVAEHEVRIADAEGVNILLSVGEPTGETEATEARELVAA